MGIVMAAKELGLVEQMLRDWVKAAAAGKPTAAGAKPVTPEQMELSRLCGKRGLKALWSDHQRMSTIS